jgi:hypothetical protein
MTGKQTTAAQLKPQKPVAFACAATRYAQYAINEYKFR